MVKFFHGTVYQFEVHKSTKRLMTLIQMMMYNAGSLNGSVSTYRSSLVGKDMVTMNAMENPGLATVPRANGTESETGKKNGKKGNGSEAEEEKYQVVKGRLNRIE